MKDAARFGTTVESVTLDWPTVIARQHAVIEELRPRPEALERAGVAVTLGEAKFTDPHTVAVNGALLWGEKIVGAAGSAAVVPDVPGIGAAITSDAVLALPRFPRRLIMIGAGVIGLEMAAAFSDLGAAVTVIGQDLDQRWGWIDRECFPLFREAEERGDPRMRATMERMAAA